MIDEFPQMPPSENGTTEMMRKLLRKDKGKDLKESEDSPVMIVSEEVSEPSTAGIIPNIPPVVAAPQKPASFNTIDTDERIDDVTDLGNLTAADLRNSSIG